MLESLYIKLYYYGRWKVKPLNKRKNKKFIENLFLKTMILDALFFYFFQALTLFCWGNKIVIKKKLKNIHKKLSIWWQSFICQLIKNFGRKIFIVLCTEKKQKRTVCNVSTGFLINM